MLRWREPLIVFCDVDGILFDRRTSSFDDAADSLDLLARREIPLVLCSSKTRAELEYVQAQLGVTGPLVCEHGAALVIPDGYFSFPIPNATVRDGYEIFEFGRPYRDIVRALKTIARREGVDILGFSDMTDEQVAACCDLPLCEARLARQREYEEPFRVVGGDRASRQSRQRIFCALRSAHLGCRHGGPFDYAGSPVDSDLAVQMLCTLYQHALGPISAVGFGLTPEHEPLLRSVDTAFVIAGHDDAPHEALRRIPAARLAPQPGVAGWAAAIQEIVRR